MIRFRLASLAAALLFPLAALAAAPNPVPDTGLPARLTSVHQVILDSPFRSRVARISAKPGDRVRRGQPLLSLRCDRRNAALAQARAALAAAASKAELRRLRARLGAARARAGQCVARAPFAGRITLLKVRPRQPVRRGAPLIGLQDDAALQVIFHAPAQWRSLLKVGDRFHLAVSETGLGYEAAVTAMQAADTHGGGTFSVEGRLIGQHPELLAGMSGHVVLRQP